MTTFRSARDLSQDFHADVIRPLLGSTPYAAGLLGWGSDVLGYDTERSTDHGWGPRLQVFVEEGDVQQVKELVEQGLPDEYGGHPVRFGWDTQQPIHHITVTTLSDWLQDLLGFDATTDLSTANWLITPQQKFLGVVAGPVYADDGRLQRIRADLQWYPDDVWLWMLACQWSRIAQEEPFVQRTYEVGDELGSRVLTARLARDVMRLALLMERTYAPYSKWFGTAFNRLGPADGLDELLMEATRAEAQKHREQALVSAYELVAARHNKLGITDEVDPTARQFHERPAMVLGAERFVDACLAQVHDAGLKDLPLIGSIDQISDSTDLLSNPAAYRRLSTIYEK
ncbi:DUF4037 domain-containing protein [Kribbella italica]|uniref:DUF4037 domain-containing protein n=1 Tax=Kribbella italica TaxID=1540520 RepID=A0A7W9J3M2_9ACTN|nr:DUF4037 domain-containing protein [Kribbella italica]MBB5834283.1 hypothetical protein [Kribbella italica]